MKICFVAMPFGAGDEYEGRKEEADFIFHSIIEPSVEAAVREAKARFGDHIEHDLEVRREVDNVAGGAISSSIVRHIAHAHITIVDLTGRNPNVFLELGIRFALRRNGTILLVQDDAQVPFNIHHLRVVKYKPKYGGISRAISDLTNAVFKTMEVLATPSPPTTDSIVFDALPNLRIAGPGFMEESPEIGRVSWEEYWARTAQIEDQLSQLQAAGVYKPDILVGVSNGGLFLADTTLRLVYANDVPLVALWARRSQAKYFDNAINNALINREVLESLVPNATEKKPIQILVMDDIVGTQRTFLQLLDYFKDQLGDFMSSIRIRLVFLFTPKSETINKIGQYLLSHDRNIATNFRTVELEAITGKIDLPYRKSIHSGSITSSPEKAALEAPADTSQDGSAASRYVPSVSP